MADLSGSYCFAPDLGIWQRPDAAPFRYSDGDAVEQGLYTALQAARDRSLFSSELAALQKDWPTVYHLSDKRANLLRPFEKALVSNARILELGCGCGAVTRYLGEHAREVCAVEGSARRGAIAALRCADLKNVVVIADRIQDVPEALGQFDLVTLIGVLEYARVYGGGKGAELELLRQARRFVKPGGALVLAIENKLGLKYLAGVPEDHLGISWAGPTNAYRENGVATYSRKELLRLLQEAGFGECEQFVPLPDYKLPATIITREGLNSDSELCDLGAFLTQGQRQNEDQALFNLQESWRSVYEAGLLADLADSLCFIAHAEKSPGASSHEAGILVQHFGALPVSHKQYAKTVSLRKTPSGLEVIRAQLFPEARTTATAYTHVLSDEPYYSGTLLIDKIRRCMLRSGWTVEELARAFAPWVHFLLSHTLPDDRLPGNFLDLTPFNFIIDTQGACHPFDLEWEKKGTLPILYILMRGITYSLSRCGVVACPDPNVDIRYEFLVKNILQYFSISYSDSELESSWEEEHLFRTAMGYKNILWEVIKKSSLPISFSNVSEILEIRKNMHLLNQKNNMLIKENNDLRILNQKNYVLVKENNTLMEEKETLMKEKKELALKYTHMKNTYALNLEGMKRKLKRFSSQAQDAKNEKE